MSVPVASKEVAQTLVDPVAYGEWDGLLDIFSALRSEMPVAKVEAEGFRPFWAITRHEDILRVSKDNSTFLNGTTSTVLGPIMSEMFVAHLTGGSPHLVKSLVQMDAPEHSKYRRLTQDWFMPANLKKVEAMIRAIARDSIDRMAEMGGECDFAREVASDYPLHVVMQILGVPPEDESFMLRLTQEMFGSQDPDLNRLHTVQLPVEEMTQMMAQTVADFNAYFEALAADRRANPRDDLATVIANGLIDGAPMPLRESAGYYTITASAGHDTTAASTAGAMWALAQDPAQFERLKADRSLLPGLIEEAIRWTTPVQHFMRTAIADSEVGGVPVKAGDWMMLCYISGNYDESVFPNPTRFDAARSPNRHVAFGSGAHQCLGLHLARLEMRIFYEEMLDRVASVELAGTPSRIKSTFVGGPKNLPIRFRMN
ncbi:MAG: cytochrome P450 [Sphingomonadales bacterium]|jgi:cytochrome P450|uniref:cytochrome P450 n=1 Tax=Sphingorhabdus sp. TaxID=1902408 RepID=UPI003BAFA5EC|nr:cytochrome P450 [Sphingomonadales bacterium]MBK9431444.1 cytochrome P450 [Sphingomonadales bacterium]MBL0023089.1 cytochrome P450 [Sphingomonadales bacterium]